MAKAATPAPAAAKTVAPVKPVASAQAFDVEAQRARFWQLNNDREALLAQIAPIQEKYEAVRAKEEAARLEAHPLEEQLRTLREPLAQIDNERAFLVRGLGGRTGEDPRVVAERKANQPEEEEEVEEAQVVEEAPQPKQPYAPATK